MQTLTPEDDGVDKKQESVVDVYESFNTYIGMYRLYNKGWCVFLHSLAPRLLSHPPDKQVEIDRIITSLRDKGTSAQVTLGVYICMNILAMCSEAG